MIKVTFEPQIKNVWLQFELWAWPLATVCLCYQFNWSLIQNVISVVVWGPGSDQPWFCHGLDPRFQQNSCKWNSFCNYVFVPKVGGTVTMFMCYWMNSENIHVLSSIHVLHNYSCLIGTLSTQLYTVGGRWWYRPRSCKVKSASSFFPVKLELVVCTDGHMSLCGQDLSYGTPFVSKLLQ